MPSNFNTYLRCEFTQHYDTILSLMHFELKERVIYIVSLTVLCTAKKSKQSFCD